MHEKMRSGFRKLGNSLLALSYKDTIFDDKAKMAGKDDDEDNFDILLSTAEKVSILRPILPPAVTNHLMKKMRAECREMLNDTICSFYPTEPDQLTDPIKKNKDSDMSNVPSWLQDLIDEDDNVAKKDKNADSDAQIPPTKNGFGQDVKEYEIRVYLCHT